MRRTSPPKAASGLGCSTVKWMPKMTGTWSSSTANRVGVQLAPSHIPPDWPDGTSEQQIHLDLWVEDFPSAHDRVMALGARVLKPAEPVTSPDNFQVYADPAGHPSCLCWVERSDGRDVGPHGDASLDRVLPRLHGEPGRSRRHGDLHAGGARPSGRVVYSGFVVDSPPGRRRPISGFTAPPGRHGHGVFQLPIDLAHDSYTSPCRPAAWHGSPI
jgi:hypothetical protein